MDFIYGLAFNLLLKVLFDKPAVHCPEPPPPKPYHNLMVEAQERLVIPDWVTSPPSGCFVGISRPCQSVAEAREQALNSAVSQILEAMGAEYSLYHKSTISGTATHSEHELHEKLMFTARWFVSSVQQNIQRSDVQKIRQGYLCFVLIHFPKPELERLRKLTIGPKIGARIIRETSNQFHIEARESNGVQVNLTDYHVEIVTHNRHARLITLFARKVPVSHVTDLEGSLQEKICLQTSSQAITIPHPKMDQGLKTVILGSEKELKITLRGYDEIGRSVSVVAQRF